MPCADIVPASQGSYHPCADHTMWSRGEQGEQRRTPTSAAVSVAPAQEQRRCLPVPTGQASWAPRCRCC